MKLDPGFLFDHSFQKIDPILFERVNPTPIENAKLIHATHLKTELGLGQLSDDELRCWLNGEDKMEGEQRISTRYAGHQFGVWAGQLGDGRAISMAEILTPKSERFEIQTKGSGLTPFSRMGDGKAVIRSSVREYLCSEALYGLNIPTTRVLALLTGEDQVRRETIERSALIGRVFPSNIRFGHFEYCFHFEHPQALNSLIEYTRTIFFNSVSIEEMLSEIVKRTAHLMAAWQNVGFCHGVMNTDNMSILGITIDYGPFGFLEDTILNHICNHSDHRGRYAYNRQPSVAMWNLERLLVCFMNHVPREKLEALLNSFSGIFEKEYVSLSLQKLGLEQEFPGDYELFVDLLKTMNTLNVDYTFFFRQLCHYEKGTPSSLKNFWDYYGQREEIKTWIKRYDERLSRESRTDSERKQAMLKTNPKYVLRNYIAQEVIADVEAGSDQKLKEWLEILYQPFAEHPAFDRYAWPTPAEHKHIEVSCSS